MNQNKRTHLNKKRKVHQVQPPRKKINQHKNQVKAIRNRKKVHNKIMKRQKKKKEKFLMIIFVNLNYRVRNGKIFIMVILFRMMNFTSIQWIWLMIFIIHIRENNYKFNVWQSE